MKKSGGAIKLTPLRCWVCKERPALPDKGRGRPATPWRICGATECIAKREVAYTMRRMDREASQCRVCTGKRYGRTFCEQHRWMKMPCACGGKIERTQGPGRRFEKCAACRAKRAS